MGELEGKIDRTRGVGQRPNGDKVDTGGGDLPYVPQVYSSAGFEFHLSFSDRERMLSKRITSTPGTSSNART
jgi:hypothetical protein